MESPPTQSISVLVADDDEDQRALLEGILSAADWADYHVTSVPDGRSALGALRERVFDVALLDLSMPGLDGRETLLEIRNLRPELPVVVASGFGESVTAVRFPSAEIASFVRKPYEAKEIADAVRNALTG